MCIRDRPVSTHGTGQSVHARCRIGHLRPVNRTRRQGPLQACLLYTSDAADERSSVDLGGRRIIKKKNTTITIANTTARQKQSPEQIAAHNIKTLKDKTKSRN